MAKEKNASIVDEWLDEDNLELLECWARDGYTLADIADRIGIHRATLDHWRKTYPEIAVALKRGREIIDYKVENALLKSALGYKTKEVKVTTLMRFGKVIETTKEVTHKEQAPNVSAINMWLCNRLPDKWKKNRDQIINLDDEDTSIQVTVTRANSANIEGVKRQPKTTNQEDEIDEEWQDEMNTSIEISRRNQEEATNTNKNTSSKDSNKNRKTSSQESEPKSSLDEWPDDWEDTEDEDEE